MLGPQSQCHCFLDRHQRRFEGYNLTGGADRRMRLQSILLSLILIAAGGCSPETESGPVPEVVEEARPERAEPTAAADGLIEVRAWRVELRPTSQISSNTVLESSRKVTMHAGLDAIVETILVEEGSPVSPGDVLARLEGREIRNEHRQSELAVEQSEVALQQGEVQANLSVLNHERALSLFEERLVSQQEVDQAELSRQSDELSLEAARLASERATAQLERAEIQLEQTEIRSSIEGVVTSRLVSVGDRVSPLEDAFIVEDFAPLLAPVFVSESEWTRLRVGQEARVNLEVFPDRTFEGRIETISPTVDATSRTARVTVEINGGSDALRPGLFGSVTIAEQPNTSRMAVPESAVRVEAGLTNVFVVTADQRVESRRVVVQSGRGEEGWVDVVEGVLEGEAIVTGTDEILEDGDPVQVTVWD